MQHTYVVVLTVATTCQADDEDQAAAGSRAALRAAGFAGAYVDEVTDVDAPLPIVITPAGVAALERCGGGAAGKLLERHAL
jgi:hypothetical protein